MASRAPARQPIAPPPVQHAEDGTVVPPPPITPDVITRLNPTVNTFTNSGDFTTIDVLPNMHYPLMSWFYSLAHSIQSSTFSTNPVASPASVMAYTISLFTGLFFFNDAFLRSSPSDFAASILNDHLARMFFDTMLDFHVPAFAHSEFTSFQPHFDELAQNLIYIGTLAGSSFLHDFTRLPPATVFMYLHNLLADLPTNSGSNVLSAHFYSSTAVEVNTAPTGQPANNIDILVAHLFGKFISHNNTINVNNNWINFHVDQFLTTNAIRVVNAAGTVTRLPFVPLTRVTVDNYNPYHYLSGYDTRSRNSFLTLLHNLNDFIKTSWPTSRPLRSYTQFGTQEIVRHLTLDCILPTWHLQTLTAPQGQTLVDLFSTALTHRTVITPTDYATAIQYLAPRPAPAATTIPPSVETQVGNAAPNNTGVMIDLVVAPSIPPTTVDPAGIRSFDETRHNMPSCMIFDPSSAQTAHLSSVIIAGKIIELNDLSAVGIPLPTPFRPLNVTNSEFALGAIPMAKIQTAITGVPWTVRRRNMNTRYRIPQIIVRSLPDRLIIPAFRTGFVRPTTDVATNLGQPLLNFLPGATIVNQSFHAHDGINVFASPLGETPASVPDQFFQLWSSFRYFDEQSRTWYMLPTLRHIYGTRTRMSMTLHPSSRIH